MPVYFRDCSAQTIVYAATPRQKLKKQLLISRIHSILTPGHPVQDLTLQRQAPGRVGTGKPVLKSLVLLDPEKKKKKIVQAGIKPRVFCSRGGRLDH